MKTSSAKAKMMAQWLTGAPMPRRNYYGRLMPAVRLMLLMTLTALAEPQPSAALRTNILIMLADDLGYADIGVQRCCRNT